MKVEGGCYCGAVRYAAEGDVMFRGQCHCRECQYISGGAPNLVLGMQGTEFEYTKGQPAAFRRSDLEKPVTREFCAVCGTHLVGRSPGFPLALIKVGTLDDPEFFEGPQMALYTIDMPSFHQVPEGIATFERMPG
ncbi:MAG: GFA family protein [Deltaproteobacteria bacterium]|nr:GFA family protein [Deltaproteobacteria bacterium]